MGITADALWSKVTINGQVTEIIGAKPRSRKYPILGRRTDGKVYKFAASAVARAIATKEAGSHDHRI